MREFLLASGVIMLVLTGWILVQQMARRFALRHPEFGPYRERGSCGGDCTCTAGGDCRRK
ncbi:MAG: chemotaxis protein [Chromatiaceae bacterium]|nr:chemotaxis protein [Chromatiaceae bacterium]